MPIAAKVEDHGSGQLVLHIAARLVKGDGYVAFPGGDPERLTAIGKAAFTGVHAVTGVVVIYVSVFHINVMIAEAFDRTQVVADILDGVRAAIKAETGEDLDVSKATTRGGSLGGGPNNFVDHYLAADAAASLEVPPSWNVAAVARVLGALRAWLADAGVDLDDPKVTRAALATLLFVDQVAREGEESEPGRATVAYDLLQKLLPLLAGEVRQQHDDSR
jgi:hypothetical protein